MPDSLQPIARPLALSDQVYRTLRDYLRAGRFEPGERLTEVSLSERLGVSRTPVREALARLASEGLVDNEGRSYAVPTIEDGDIEDIYEVRCLLEPAALRRVAETLAGAAQLAPLKAALAASRAAHESDDGEAFMSANAEFRNAWLALVPNARLVRAVELYTGHVRYLRVVTLDDARVRAVVLKGLERILQALAAKDGTAAEQAMLEHLGEARRCLRAAAGLNAAAAESAALG